MIHERANERWEVCVAPSDDGFQSVSFVNSICTMKAQSPPHEFLLLLLILLCEVSDTSREEHT